MSEQSEKLGFLSLTPESLTKEQLEIYYDAFNYIFSNEDIKNIAISGSYGSGKSTILKSIQKIFDDKNFINISLASFNKDESSDELINKLQTIADNKIETGQELPEDFQNYITSKKEEQNDLERQLELSILQQIFYHVDPAKIPDSRFKRINALSKDDLVFFSIQTLIWLASIMFAFFPKTIPFYDQLHSVNLYRLISLIVFFSGLWYLVQHLRRVYNNSKVNKLNIQSGEFEIEKDVEQSILNKNLDEIIYFFQVTDYEVLIFEDLDRFDNKEIFSKLREINLLINNSKQVDKRVIFIYAVRDNLFTGDSRTKFFDFIIPIIPYINYSNSKEILGTTLEKMYLRKKPSDQFIREISVFIHDMRFLNNVLNEYKIYNSKVGENLDQNKLFGIILFKNFYPSHFAEIHENNGVLNQLFTLRKKLIELKISDYNEDLKSEKERLRTTEENIDLNKSELWRNYVDAMRRHIQNSLGVVLENGTFITFNELYDSEDNVKEEIIKSPNIKVRKVQYPERGNSPIITQFSDFSFSDIGRLVNSVYSFEERKEMMEVKYTEEIKDRIKDLDYKIKKVKYNRFKDLINPDDLKNRLDGIINVNPLIYLIKNGFIDEDFMSYVSYFHPHSLKPNDNRFLEAIYSNSELPYNYSLENVENLIREINIQHFDSSNILNFDLVSELFDKHQKYSERFNVVLDQLSNGTEKSYDFVKSFMPSENENFLRLIIKKWKGLWRYIERDKELSQSTKTEYFLLMVKYGEGQEVFEQSLYSKMKIFLEDHPSVLKVMDRIEVSDKFSNLILQLKIKFKSINIESITRDNNLFWFMYNNDLYSLNENMVKLIITLISKIEVESKQFNYSLIHQSDIKKLKNYATNNINELVQSIVSKGAVITENDNTLCDLLNHDGLKEEFLNLYLDLISNSIEDINQIRFKKTRFAILKHFKMKASWENINIVYNDLESQLSEDLFNYLNNGKINSELRMQSGIRFEKKMSLYGRIITNNNFTFNSYKNLVTGLQNSPFKNLDLNGLDYERVEWLIKKKILFPSKENYSNLKKSHSPLQLELLKINQKRIKDFSIFSIDHSDFTSIINSTSFSKNITLEIVEIHQNILSEIKPELLKTVLKLLSSHKIKIELELDNIKLFFQNIDFSESENRLFGFFNIYVGELDLSNIIEVLSVFPDDYSKLLVKNRRQKFPKEKPYSDFCEILRSNSITHYKENSDHIVLTGKGYK